MHKGGTNNTAQQMVHRQVQLIENDDWHAEVLVNGTVSMLFIISFAIGLVV